MLVVAAGPTAVMGAAAAGPPAILRDESGVEEIKIVFSGSIVGSFHLQK